MKKQSIDLTGKRFGRLTAIDPAERINGRTAWNCVCKCGKLCTKITNVLRTGRVKSCGCLQRDAPLKHGLCKNGSRTPEYVSWQAMLGRCRNPKHEAYYLYGGRGIVVCKRWKNSFSAFLKDMGTRPTNSHTLDRIDGNGNYEPSNCRWATRKEQSSNMRSNRFVVLNGERLTIAEASRRLGLTKTGMRHRVNKYGPVKSVDMKFRRNKKRNLTTKGEKNRV